jgi:O-antigen/teichoic acid export membrane protein
MRKSILVNTVALYLRQTIVVLINLYVVRLVLNELGVIDYGIYNVILGVTAIFSFIPSAMTVSIQRQFVFAIGKGKAAMQNVFASSLLIYFILIIVSTLILCTVGMYFVYNFLEVPINRHESSLFIYICSVIIFVFSIGNSLLISLVIAHEDMKVFAFLSVVEAILKLFSAFLLQFTVRDKLMLYGVLTSISALVIFALYNIACIKYYKKYNLNSLSFDFSLFKKTLRFSGWTLFGFFTSVLRTHAVTILVNQWFNPVVVAAKIISSTISTQFMLFANNLNTALYPPIVREYANKELLSVKKLVIEGSKVSFFLVWILALPVLLETEYILSLWLITPPDNAILFTRLGLIESLLVSLGLVVGSAARATGEIKRYEIVLGTIQVISFVITFIVLFAGAPAFSVFIVGIFTNVIMLIVRAYITSSMVGIDIKASLLRAVLSLLLIVSVSYAACYMISMKIEHDFARLVLTILVGTSSSFLMMCIFGISQELRDNIVRKIKAKIVVG